MLSTLTIDNIALIEHAEIAFGKGLNILTGETGAGKSIMIDSLNFVLGGRADKSLIRYGQDEASVEAEFINVNDRVTAMLAEYGIEYDGELILTRKMSTDGRNVCRVNGVKTTVGGLKEVAGALVDIYGQHENSVLLDSSTHLGILDRYGKELIGDNLIAFQTQYAHLKDTNKEIAKYGGIKEMRQKSETLERQIDEIRKAELHEGEEERLSKKLEMAENTEFILENLTRASASLNGEVDGNAVERVVDALKALEGVSEYDAEWAECVNRLSDLREELRDVAMTVSRSLERIDFDEYEARDTERRLDVIRTVESKYGDTEAEVLKYLDKITKEYDFCANAEGELTRLNTLADKQTTAAYQRALELTECRKAVAARFCAAVVGELQALGMPKTRFEIVFDAYAESDFMRAVSESGCDSVEFMISPNAGQPLKPLAKIISGGEMSRFMLAIKKISAEIDGVNAMVFDEIDTGISGRIASVVAEKLYDISRDRQVLAVTHLPQLASMADSHFLIEKTSDGVETKTQITPLTADEMIAEIAWMIDASAASASAVAHAKSMKDGAKAYKSHKN